MWHARDYIILFNDKCSLCTKSAQHHNQEYSHQYYNQQTNRSGSKVSIICRIIRRLFGSSKSVEALQRLFRHSAACRLNSCIRSCRKHMNVSKTLYPFLYSCMLASFPFNVCVHFYSCVCLFVWCVCVCARACERKVCEFNERWRLRVEKSDACYINCE